MSKRPRECRACRCVIPQGQLACREHWATLPAGLRQALTSTWRRRDLRTYADLISDADVIWRDAGVWRPGIPGDIPTLEVMRLRGELD